jgi:hypothetical protein
MATVSDQPETKITLAEAFKQYHVPMGTLRYWLDRGWLTRDFDEQQRVVISVEQLKRRIAESGRKYE